MDLLGSIFRKLTELGGGSELVPLLTFCVFLVVLGLALGLAVTRLLRFGRPGSDVGAEQS